MGTHTCTHSCTLTHKHITDGSHKRQKKVNKSPTTFEIQIPQLH